MIAFGLFTGGRFNGLAWGLIGGLACLLGVLFLNVAIHIGFAGPAVAVVGCQLLFIVIYVTRGVSMNLQQMMGTLCFLVGLAIFAEPDGMKRIIPCLTKK